MDSPPTSKPPNIQTPKQPSGVCPPMVFEHVGRFTAGRCATRRIATDSKCRRLRAKKEWLHSFRAFGLVARRHFGIGRGSHKRPLKRRPLAKEILGTETACTGDLGNWRPLAGTGNRLRERPRKLEAATCSHLSPSPPSRRRKARGPTPLWLGATTNRAGRKLRTTKSPAVKLTGASPQTFLVHELTRISRTRINPC